MAKFFKSIAFKCTATLLAIACLSGGLLAVLNDLLYVSPAERTARAMSKIYDQAVEILDENVLLDIDSDTRQDTAIDYGFGKINKIYLVGDKNAPKYDLVFQTVGNEGYKGGTITLWIKVVVTDGNLAEAKPEKVVLETYTKQTLMSQLNDYYYEQFIEKYNAGEFFTSDVKQTDGIKNPVSGATMSAMAGCNAVNCVVYYLKNGGFLNEN